MDTMASYALEKNERGDYSVMGLKFSDHDPEWDSNDILLIYRYGDGSCDTITENNQHMHATLYDLYNSIGTTLQDGDTFTLDGVVVYRCEGVHVVKVD
jgi:hypothetical protein